MAFAPKLVGVAKGIDGGRGRGSRARVPVLVSKRQETHLPPIGRAPHRRAKDVVGRAASKGALCAKAVALGAEGVVVVRVERQT